MHGRLSIAIGLVVYFGIGVRSLAAAEATLSTADGESVAGELVQILAEGIGLDTGSGLQIVPTELASRLEFAHEPKPNVPTLVELNDGTRIRVTLVTWGGGDLEVVPSRQSALRIPIAQVKSIRFRPGNAATDATWLGWSEDARRGDRLAVRRDEKTLDSLDGTVGGIGTQTVQFEIGGNAIEAPIAKLEGVLFSSSNPATASGTAIRVNDTSGSQYLARSVMMQANSDVLKIELSGDVWHTIPVDQLLSIGFAGGVLQLANVEVASSGFGNSVTRPRAANSRAVNGRASDWLEAWFLPQTSVKDRSGEDLIVMQSPGEIRFRIPEGYQRFEGAVRRHPEVELFVPLRVEVLADDAIVWSASLDSRDSLGLELPLGDARILTLRSKVMAPTGDSVDAHNNDVSVDVFSSTLGGQIQWFGGRLFK